MIKKDEIARLRAALEKARAKPIGLTVPHYGDPSYGYMAVESRVLSALLDALEDGKPTREQIAVVLTSAVIERLYADAYRGHYVLRDMILDALAAAGYLREPRTGEQK